MRLELETSRLRLQPCRIEKDALCFILKNRTRGVWSNSHKPACMPSCHAPCQCLTGKSGWTGPDRTTVGAGDLLDLEPCGDVPAIPGMVHQHAMDGIGAFDISSWAKLRRRA
jgi:hypothetical protein